MPATARGLGIDPNNPRQALEGAARLMKSYVDKYGSYRDALVAYNAGPGRVGGSLPSETQNYLRTILGGREPKTAAGARTTGGGGARTTTTTTTPGVDNSTMRAQLIQSFLEDTKADPVTFALGMRSAADVPGTTSTRTIDRTGGADAGGGISRDSPLAIQAKQRADVINAQNLPYSWGGGHGGRTPLHQAVPLDCSGAVSKVLGIDPRVSGDFQKWGRPGDGGSKGVTVYANGHHVLMKINGHFFGTSAANPGGGAGWIPSSQLSPEYLRGFTARHSER
jgi:hypothetical protein